MLGLFILHKVNQISDNIDATHKRNANSKAAAAQESMDRRLATPAAQAYTAKKALQLRNRTNLHHVWLELPADEQARWQVELVRINHRMGMQNLIGVLAVLATLVAIHGNPTLVSVLLGLPLSFFVGWFLATPLQLLLNVRLVNRRLDRELR